MAEALTDIKFNGERIPAGTEVKEKDFPADVWQGLIAAGAVKGELKSEPEPESEESQVPETGSEEEQPAESTTTRAAEPAAPPAKEGK